MLFWNLSLSVLDNFRCLLMVSRSIQRRLDRRQGYDIRKQLPMSFQIALWFLVWELRSLLGCIGNGKLDQEFLGIRVVRLW